MGSIRDAIRQLAQQDGETIALVCTVDEIDKEARTIDCTPINEGAPLLASICKQIRGRTSVWSFTLKKGLMWLWASWLTVPQGSCLQRTG